jgi:hypothetical protein
MSMRGVPTETHSNDSSSSRPCATYLPDSFQTTSLKDGTIDAVLLSSAIVNYQKDHPNPALQFLFDNLNHPGWTSSRLDEGYSIFYRLPAGNASH